jgi:tetratricopeptide (TPR) repeat protein
MAPENPTTHRLLAELKEQQEQGDEAVKLYRRVLELQPQVEEAANAYLRIGTILLKQKRYEEAEKELQQAIDNDPRHVEAYYNLGTVYEQQGQIDRAIENYTKTTQLVPKHLDAYRALGRIFGKQGDTKSLAQMARNILDLDLQPSARYDAYLLIANAYQAVSLYEWAIDYLNKAISIDDKQIAPYASLGLIYEVQQRWGKAREAYEKIGEKLPEAQPDVHLRLNQLFISEGNFESAEAELNKINTKALEPNDVRYKLLASGYLELASIYRKNGNLEAMKGLCAKTISLTKSLESPDYDNIRHQGLADFMLGNYEKAAQSFRKALTETPADAKARLYLALALLPLGDDAQAQSQLTEAIAQAKSKDDYIYAIEEANVLSNQTPEVPGAKAMLQALREASDKVVDNVAVQG